MKKIVVLLLCLVLAFSVVACSGSDSGSSSDVTENNDGESTADSADVIKIGVFEPFTGDKAQGGELTMEGILQANEEVSEVLGKKVELVQADNKSVNEEAANAVSRLIDNENVSAIIGSYGSSLSIAAGPIVLENRVPAVGCSPTNPLVTQDNEFYFRVCFIDPFQGTVMANYAAGELKATKAAIIKNAQNDYSIGLAKFFVDSFKAKGGEVVAEAQYNPGDKDFTAQLNAVKEKGAEVIFAPGDYGESALLIKQAREMGIDLPILGGDTWEAPDFISIAGDGVNLNVFFSSHFTAVKPVNDVSDKFLADYKAKFNKEANAFAALGYDAYMLIIDAIERAGSADPEAIQAELVKTEGFVGATGTITLDENGDAVKDAVINTVKDGKFEYLTTVQP